SWLFSNRRRFPVQRHRLAVPFPRPLEAGSDKSNDAKRPREECRATARAAISGRAAMSRPGPAGAGRALSRFHADAHRAAIGLIHLEPAGLPDEIAPLAIA